MSNQSKKNKGCGDTEWISMETNEDGTLPEGHPLKESSRRNWLVRLVSKEYCSPGEVEEGSYEGNYADFMAHLPSESAFKPDSSSPLEQRLYEYSEIQSLKVPDTSRKADGFIVGHWTPYVPLDMSPTFRGKSDD